MSHFPDSHGEGYSPTSPHQNALRVNLMVPMLRVGFGIFSIDPIAQLLGMPLSQVLEPLLVGPVTQRMASSGGVLEVFPLALPDGEGASIRLGPFGELGFGNSGGLLRLMVPWSASGWLLQRLGPHLVAGPEALRSADGASWLAQVWVRLEPGLSTSIPLGTFGELSVEAG